MPSELTDTTTAVAGPFRGAADTPDTPVLAPLTRMSSRSDLVAETIRSAILRGQLQPGETLVERKLADMLGVSKTPVREALIGLARRGLVTMNPNRGVTVRVIDAAALRKICEVRLQLEPWAVGRAIGMHRRGEVDEAAFHESRAALHDADAAVERDDQSTLTRINRRFHRSLYSWCGNELVCSILDDLQDQLALGVVSHLWRQAPTWRAETGEHHAIMRAATDGDAPLAEELMRSHIELSLRSLGQRMDAQ